MDPKTQQIVVVELTPNSRDDASVVPELLAQIDDEIGFCTATEHMTNDAYTKQPPNVEFAP